MLRRTPLALALVLSTSLSSSMWAQSVISAHSGMVHLTEGTVELDGKAIQSPAKLGEFVDVKTGQTLATKDGDAEVLLTPGVFLRLAENSSFKMVSNKLADTRVEILSGTAMLQVDELLQDNAITVLFRNADIELSKRGLYRIESDPARLRVYDGEAKISSGDMKPIEAKKGHEVAFDADKLEAKNFDTKETDAFYRWNERRDEYIAQANITAAKTARDSGAGFSGNSAYNSGYGAGMGSWAWNPWFGMFTFMPMNGMYYSPFGFGYFSPSMVGYLYMPGSPYYYGGGVNRGTYSGVTRGGVTRGGAPTTFGGGLAGATTRGGFSGVGGVRGGAGPMGGGVRGGGGFSGGGGTAGARAGGGGMAGGAHGGGGRR